ncbi:odorant receptor 22b-like [Zootermopsis nevadensis]|nr:odorant receptor 22b-like [Zootermopsis nevadensis]
MIPWIQKLTILGTCLVLGPHSIYMFVRSIGTEKLGLRMWTPYDARPSPVHEITVIIQVLSTLVDVTIFTGFVGLYATLVAIACTQLEKLQEGLKNFRNEKELKPNTEQEKLKEHIRFHQSILSFMGALEDTLNILVLGHFLVIVGALCFGVISAVAIWGNAGDLLQIILVMCSITAQLGMYCWFGERLTNQAEGVKQAVWESEWVGAPLQQQRDLAFVMAEANKQFVLTAGGFTSLSHHTLIMVANQVMSYTMFLVNVRDENDRA